MRASLFRTAEEDAQLAVRLPGGLLAGQRQQIRVALSDNQQATQDALRLIVIHQFFQGQRKRGRVQFGRRGRPVEDFLPWFIDRAQRIFRAARWADAFSRSESAFVHLMVKASKVQPSRRAQALLNLLVDEPLGPVAKRQRDIERIAAKVSRLSQKAEIERSRTQAMEERGVDVSSLATKDARRVADRFLLERIREMHVNGTPIRAIERQLNVSRGKVRSVLRQRGR